MTQSEALLEIVNRLGIKIHKNSTLEIASVDFVEFIIAIETEFGIEITSEIVHMVDFRNLNSISAFLERKHAG